MCNFLGFSCIPHLRIMATEQNVNMEQKGPDLQQPIEDPPAAETVAQDPPVQEEPSKPETEAPRPTDNTDEIDERVLSRMSWVDRFLSVWILLAVGIGIALSYIPGLSKFFNETTAVGSTNILLAIGLIVMMYPPLAKVDYSTLPSLVRQPRYFFLSLILNWIVGPILMVVLALLIMGKTQVCRLPYLSVQFRLRAVPLIHERFGRSQWGHLIQCTRGSAMRTRWTGSGVRFTPNSEPQGFGRHV